MIPRRLVRVVPEKTTQECEVFWDRACRLHPFWDYITLRDPIDDSGFPMTRKCWDTCKSGAQLADLVRVEELYQRGGVYIDSDYEVLRSFEPLSALYGWAGWEDENVICNAVMGFEPRHWALLDVIEMAIQRHDLGTWESGVGTVTEVFRNCTDIVLLPPQALYPVHYKHKGLIRLWERERHPWALGMHHWRHSWEGK